MGGGQRLGLAKFGAEGAFWQDIHPDDSGLSGIGSLGKYSHLMPQGCGDAGWPVAPGLTIVQEWWCGVVDGRVANYCLIDQLFFYFWTPVHS